MAECVWMHRADLVLSQRNPPSEAVLLPIQDPALEGFIAQHSPGRNALQALLLYRDMPHDPSALPLRLCF